MSSVLSNYLGNAALTQYFDATTYLSLHSGDPGTTGAGEIGQAYTRPVLIWSVPSNKTIGNTNELRFPTMTPVTLLYFGVWTEQVGGNFLVSIELPSSIVIADGDTLVLPPNEIAITL